MNHIYNVVPQKYDSRDYRLLSPTPQAVAVLPDKFDLRSLGIVPEIWDQGQLGSCTANGNGAIFEIDRLKQGYAPLNPSRLFIYYNERMEEGNIDSDYGANVRTGIKVMNKYGVANEDIWAYNINQYKTKPPQNVYDDGATRKVSTYTSVHQNINDICAAIYSGKGVVFGFQVFESFDSNSLSGVSGTGIMTIPQANEQSLGGHCVCAIGFEITKRGGKHGGFFGPLLDKIFGMPSMDGYIICRNSWGTYWGLSGYFKMPFKFINNSVYCYDFWVVDAVDA
jgi:C1A family cysteine protease